MGLPLKKNHAEKTNSVAGQSPRRYPNQFFSVRLKIFLIDFYQTRQVFRPRERIEKFYRIIYKLGSHSLGHIKSMLECQKCCGHGFFSCRPKKKKSPGMREVLIKHKTIKWTPNGKALPIRPRGKI